MVYMQAWSSSVGVEPCVLLLGLFEQKQTCKRLVKIVEYRSATLHSLKNPSWFNSCNYCSSLLMDTPYSVIQTMQKIQNYAKRLLLKASRHEHCTLPPATTSLASSFSTDQIKTACMCYNSVTGSVLLSYLSELLRTNSPSHSLRSSSDTRMLKLQRFKRKTHGFRFLPLRSSH